MDLVRHKKILYFVAEADYFCSHRLHLALAARKASYQVALLARCSTETGQKLEQLGISVFALKHFKRASLNPFRQIRSLLEIYRIYKRYKPDVVHQVALKPVIFGSWIASICGVPRVINALPGLGYLFTEGGSFLKNISQWLVLRIFKNIFSEPNSILILQNTDDQHYLIEQGVLKAERSVMIPGAGVNVNHYQVTPFPPTPPVRIVCICRLLWHKGIGELAEAAAILKALMSKPSPLEGEGGTQCRMRGDTVLDPTPHPPLRGTLSRNGRGMQTTHALQGEKTLPPPRFDIVLYGVPDPENPSSIPEATLKAWEKAGLLRWLGHCEDVASAYANAHIAVLPSYREGLPKSLLEAASCGRPIVTTDVPGCRAIVQDGENGLLVPAHDADALAKALTRLIADPELRTRMGLAGRKWVEASFSEQGVQEKTLALYR